jgi:hypothetical protein
VLVPEKQKQTHVILSSKSLSYLVSNSAVNPVSLITGKVVELIIPDFLSSFTRLFCFHRNEYPGNMFITGIFKDCIIIR